VGYAVGNCFTLERLRWWHDDTRGHTAIQWSDFRAHWHYRTKSVVNGHGNRACECADKCSAQHSHYCKQSGSLWFAGYHPN
jgi:hypothetical protein